MGQEAFVQAKLPMGGKLRWPTCKCGQAGVHMHLLGTRARLWLERSNTQQECLLKIPEWDFGWQGSVDLVEPITVHAGDLLHLECAWDNSRQNQPVVDGEQLEPQDVGWGDGTDDEMCLAILFVTAVPGP